MNSLVLEYSKIWIMRKKFFGWLGDLGFVVEYVYGYLKNV